MNRPGIVERWQLSQPGVIAAVVAGIVLGGAAGATFKGSGMFFSNLILGGGLLLVLVFVGLGAIVARLAHRADEARILAVFTGVTVIATGVVYALAPRYRSTSDPIDHGGDATLHIAEYAETEWRAQARCRRGPLETTVSDVAMLDVKIGERWVSVFVQLSPGATSARAGKLTIGSYRRRSLRPTTARRLEAVWTRCWSARTGCPAACGSRPSCYPTRLVTRSLSSTGSPAPSNRPVSRHHGADGREGEPSARVSPPRGALRRGAREKQEGSAMGGRLVEGRFALGLTVAILLCGCGSSATPASIVTPPPAARPTAAVAPVT